LVADMGPSLPPPSLTARMAEQFTHFLSEAL
jgi:hypothetical protein